ncbi:MAG: hypothetical protein L3J76_00975, partial [Candidatus Hydrothermae bacterium]|nr:hypothetical protein [Candidatus Hydrothermae bacterium]
SRTTWILKASEYLTFPWFPGISLLHRLPLSYTTQCKRFSGRFKHFSPLPSGEGAWTIHRTAG